MDKILNDVFHSVRDGFVSMTAKANELAHAGRLKIDAVTIQHSIDKLFQELGERVFHLTTLESQSQIAADPKVKSMIHRIQALQLQLKEKQQQAHDIFYNEVLEEREPANAKTTTTTSTSSASPAGATTNASTATTTAEPAAATGT